MASNKDNNDSVEKNILFLKELKNVVIAKKRLFDLKLEMAEPKNTADINQQQERKTLVTSLLKQKHLENSIYRVALDSFLTEDVMSDKSEEPKFLEYKTKIIALLQKSNESTKELQKLYLKFQELAARDIKIKEEILQSRAKRIENLERIVEQETDSDKEEKKEIEVRVQKINFIRTLINGLIFNVDHSNMENMEHPLIVETIKKCRYPFKPE